MNTLTLLDTASKPAQQQSASGGLWVMIIYVAVLGLAMYFLLIRPNKKKKKQLF